MKRFFLIPLVAFFACATAWATNPTTAADLQAAVNAATDNVATTITLGDNISSDGTIVSIPSGKVITLDLNGYTLTSNAAAGGSAPIPAIANEGVLHLQGSGNIISQTNTAIYNGALGLFSSAPARRNMAAKKATARKTLQENEDPAEPWITFTGSFNITAENAIVNAMTMSWESATISIYASYTGQVTGDVGDIMGGFLKENFRVNGGKFDQNISANVTIPDGYYMGQVGDWYQLIEGEEPAVYVAQVGDTQYESFKEAFEAIYNMDEEGYTEQTVTLLMDVDLAPAGSWEDELDNQINKSVTLDLNGHNITAALPSSYRCIFLMTHYDAILTIIGDGQFIMTAEEPMWGDPWTLSFNNIISNSTESHIVLNGGSYPVAPVASYMPMGYTASLTEGYYVVAEDNNDPRKLFNDYLTGSSSALFTVSANTDMSGYGPYQITGTKNIKVNDGVTLKLRYKYDDNIGKGSPLYVANGGSLTLTGNGTIVSNRSPIYVVNGGNLVIGATDGSDALNINTVRGADEEGSWFQKDYAIENHGVATIYNVVMDARSNAIYNRADGEMYIKKATIVGHSNSVTDVNGLGAQWAYAVINDGKMVMNNASVTGIHGAVACESGKGTLELHNCDLKAMNLDNNGGVHYALYTCTNAIVSAYNTKFYSDNASYTIYIGNNDANNTFGLIYLYDGCKTDKKMFVQKKKDTDATVLFPVLVSEESDWYKAAMRIEDATGEGPLPANCVYQEISSGDDYAAGYRFTVVNNKPAEQQKEVDENATTIPWQQSSTWNASASSESTTEVPTEVTVVTIPEGKTVVISADENENNGVTEAKAEQIFLADGAKLTVETGTTLTVGEGGVNIANGGQIVVEPGAIVTVGSTGLVTTEEEALVIEATEEDQGVFLLKPEVTENTQPKATVKLVTKCKQKAAGEYVWERFAIPTLDGEQTTFSIEGGTAGITTYDGSAFQQGLYGWSDAEQDWVGLDRFKDMKPFKGYQLSNNSRDAGVTYVFEGNLVGNTDQNYQFAQTGFGFFGNSYTGDIDILKFFESFDENMQKTIWIYDYYADGFKAITANNYGTVYYGTRKARHGAITDIRSMQAFLMNTFAEGQSVQNVDYSAAIWGNPKYGLVAAPAPKRVLANNNEDKVTIYVATDKSEDEITFIRSNEYSAEFDNGADASKWMNSNFNLYAVTDNGELAVVASDEIVDMTIAFKSGKETEYTLGFDNLRGEQFELRDVLTGATIQMMEGTTYTFSQEANTTIPARFQILGAKKVATDIENIEEGANVQQKVVKNGVLYILRDNKWYNAQGQLVK